VAARDWPRAFELLSAADERRALDAEGLVLLAECARWTGRSEAIVDALERAHAAHAAAGRLAAAARIALDLVQANRDLGKAAVGASWLTRAEGLLEGLPEGTPHGLLLWFQGRAAGERGDIDGHEACARRVLEIAQRHDDRGLEALALIDLGHVATARSRTSEALESLERATALALSGEIGLFEAGLVFCNAIWACRSRGEWGRAFEWTDSATRWVVREQLGYFPALCRVHRSEVLRIRGRLAEAEVEAQEALRQLAESIPRWVTIAQAELGEVRRRRGDLAGAMEAFRRALELGWDPEPGLALCLAAQGDALAAHRTLERLFRGPQPILLSQDRANLLLARTVLALAVAERAIATEAVAELEAIAEREQTPWDRATAALARGMLQLHADDPAGAVEPLLRARALWSELDAPFELATTSGALGEALLGEGDAAGARLALTAARETFERIGAAHERARLERRLAELEGAEPARGAPAASAERREAELRRTGDLWSLRGGEREVHLRDGRGLSYLAQLLERPGVELAALELSAGGSAHASVDGGDGGELLDAEARADYRQRLEGLEEELEQATRDHDEARAERLAQEKSELVQALAAAVGLGGRARRAPGAAERARQSVTKALRGVVKRIVAEDPALGRHLERCVRTGMTCCYQPDPDHPLVWRVFR